MDEESAGLCDYAGISVQLYAGEECVRFGADHWCNGHFVFRKCGRLLHCDFGQWFYKAGHAAARVGHDGFGNGGEEDAECLGVSLWEL